MIIGIDFDGTLVEHKFPSIGKEVPLAFDYLKDFQRLGAKLILWTMRSDAPHLRNGGMFLTEAVHFCGIRGIHFWGVNKNFEQVTWTNSPKCYAQLYIDDAALGCPLITPKIGRSYVDWNLAGPMAIKAIKAKNA